MIVLRLFLATMGLLIGTILSICQSNYYIWMINQPSTTAVVLGLCLLFTVPFQAYLGVRFLYKMFLKKCITKPTINN